MSAIENYLNIVGGNVVKQARANLRKAGKGGGKLWSIDLDCKYDLGKSMLDD